MEDQRLDGGRITTRSLIIEIALNTQHTYARKVVEMLHLSLTCWAVVLVGGAFISFIVFLLRAHKTKSGVKQFVHFRLSVCLSVCLSVVLSTNVSL